MSSNADNNRHTPGPWEISFEAPRWIIQADAAVGKKAVAWLVGDYVECAPNARLIAAAPDLLEALEGPIGEVAAERRRQIDNEGFPPNHDDSHDRSEMALAAASYAVATSWTDDMREGGPPTTWPWDSSWWKPSERRRDLIKAGALIIAEIERLDRIAAITPEGNDE